MSDIVERLRDAKPITNFGSTLSASEAWQAADEIEDLRRGLEKMREALVQNSGPFADAARSIATRFGVGGDGQASVYAHTKEVLLAALTKTKDTTDDA